MKKVNEEELENLEEQVEEINKEQAEEKADSKKSEKVEELKSLLKAEKEKSDEYFEHLKRNMAEFDNFKKRISKEKDMMYNTIFSSIVAELLPVLDNFEKALNAETTDEAYKEGMAMIYNQLIESLNNQGVEEIEALNKPFDPNFHEAVMHVEDENYGEKEVVEVFRKGYKIGDKIIRHAMVKVAN